LPVQKPKQRGSANSMGFRGAERKVVRGPLRLRCSSARVYIDSYRSTVIIMLINRSDKKIQTKEAKILPF